METDHQEAESDMECSENECFDDYYNVEDNDAEVLDKKDADTDYFECLTEEQVESFLNGAVEKLSDKLNITASLAKILLNTHNWEEADIVRKYNEDANHLLISSRVKSPISPSPVAHSTYIACTVCITPQLQEKFFSLSCLHLFCKDCWTAHFEVQIDQGISTAISCMARECEVLVPEDFVLKHLTKANLREKYQQFTFKDYVKSHPQLRFCPGPDCQVIIRSPESRAKRSVCSHCKSVFCFSCGMDYHAPTDCQTIKR